MCSYSRPLTMRRLIPFLLAFCALVPAHTAGAAAMLSTSAAETRAGAVVTLEWSGLAAGTHEVELEVSLDHGRWVRISPELEASEGRFEWRVPSGYSGPARVRLRAGRAHEESVVAETVLSIVPASDPGPSRIDAGSEWWNMAEHPHAVPDGAWTGAQPVWSSLTFPPAVVPAAGDAGIVPPPAASVIPERRADAEPQAPSSRAFVAPRATPLRN